MEIDNTGTNNSSWSIVPSRRVTALSNQAGQSSNASPRIRQHANNRRGEARATNAPWERIRSPAPSVHPHFRSKAVCTIFCQHCSSALCERGMRAILLGNTSVELYSTDRPPFGVELVEFDYKTENCQ